MFIIIISSIITISSSRWMGAWIGLELNILSFISFIIETKNILSNESALKYFLIQAVASAFFLMSCIINTYFAFSFSNIFYMYPQEIIIIIPLIIKLGAAPFHTWFIIIIEGINWIKCFILIGWQKIAPLCILSYTSSRSQLIIFFSIISLVLGSLGALNQTSLRKILAFSSVNHIGWLLSSIIINKNIIILYFTFYIIINLFIIINFTTYFIYSFNQINSSPHSFPLLVSLLSIGGLPPFLGFLPKWLIIQSLISRNTFLLTFIIIITTLITLFYYLRITFCSLTLSYSSYKWLLETFKHPRLKMLNSFLSVISISRLIIFNIILI